MKKVVACIDASRYSTAICDLAAWAALRIEAPLQFIHTIERLPQKPPTLDLSGSIGLGAQEDLLEQLSAIDEQRGKIARAQGRLLLEEAKARAAKAGVVDLDVRLYHNELVETLGEIENDVRLFVIGKRGENAGAATSHLGSNLERVIRAVHRPVLVASESVGSIDSFLVAYDGSATARKALETVAGSPLLKSLSCHVLTVGDDSDTNRAHRNWAEEKLVAAGFAPALSLEKGEPEEVIRRYVEMRDINLVVTGAYGHSRIRQFVVGSTATAVLRTTNVPMILLR